MKFGKKLQELRVKAGYKQPEVAKMMGIEQSYLSKLENDRAIPSREMFEKIIHVFQLTPEKLFDGIDPTILFRDFDHIPWIAEKLKDYEQKSLYHTIRWLILSSIISVIGSVILLSSVTGLIFNNKEYTYVGSYSYYDQTLKKGFGQISFQANNYLGHFVFFGEYGKPLFIYRYDNEQFYYRTENRWLTFVGSIFLIAGLGFGLVSRYIRKHEN